MTYDAARERPGGGGADERRDPCDGEAVICKCGSGGDVASLAAATQGCKCDGGDKLREPGSGGFSACLILVASGSACCNSFNVGAIFVREKLREWMVKLLMPSLKNQAVTCLFLIEDNGIEQCKETNISQDDDEVKSDGLLVEDPEFGMKRSSINSTSPAPNLVNDNNCIMLRDDVGQMTEQGSNLRIRSGNLTQPMAAALPPRHSTTVVLQIHGEFTSLLLGVQQRSIVVPSPEVHFDEGVNNSMYQA
ncbi:hypothetical protein ACP70R_022218 [Stipagrostis hirtigluma subsp. patula]